MKGAQLRFYTYESRRHRGKPVYEWLLEQAQRMGIPGGSAFRAMAGFGRHGRLHEQHFFELAGEAPVLVELIVSDAQAGQFLSMLREEGLSLFHARLPVEYGVVGDAPETGGSTE